MIGGLRVFPLISAASIRSLRARVSTAAERGSCCIRDESVTDRAMAQPRRAACSAAPVIDGDDITPGCGFRKQFAACLAKHERPGSRAVHKEMPPASLLWRLTPLPRSP